MSEQERATLQRFYDFLDAEGVALDDFLETLAMRWREIAETEEHPATKSALESAAERLSFASMDWYVSTK